jgi:hypothetical protein
MGGCVFLFILLLYDVQPLRDGLKKIPYWNVLGRIMKKEFRIKKENT